MSIMMIPDHEFQRVQRKGFGSKKWQRRAQKRAVCLGNEGIRGIPDFRWGLMNQE